MLRDSFLGLLLSLMIFAVPIFVSAHSEGLSYETTKDGHLIDIGYEPGTIIPGEKIVFDFDLRNPTTGAQQDFSDVWVRVLINGQLLLATGVSKASFGPTTLLLRVPVDARDKLEVSARYEKGQSQITDASFSIPLADPREAKKTIPLWLISGLSGFVLEGVLGALRCSR